MSKKNVLVLLYPQNEENEIVIPVTVLRYAGYNVVIAGPSLEPVVGSRNMKIVPETTLKVALKREWDAIVVGGGPLGWRSLTDDPDVGKILKEQEKCGRLIAAICTAPIAMKNHRVMYGRRLTSYPWVEEQVREGDHYVYKYDDVVVDRNLITSKGNFTTWHFSLRIVEYLSGVEAARNAARQMLVAY